MSDLTAIVLAAGRGKRMKSDLPKVLHRAAGRPLVVYPVRAAIECGATRVVLVVSPDVRDPVEAAVRDAFPDVELEVAVQDPPRGTGDAARVGMERVADNSDVLILCGDTPLLSGEEVGALVGALRASESWLALLTCELAEPRGYGRIVRDDAGRAIAIREQRDIDSPELEAIREINAGVYAASAAPLRAALQQLEPNNAQGEYYLTDTIAIAAKGGGVTTRTGSRDALVGVNDRAQLAAAEAQLFERIRERHARAGATVQVGAFIDDTVQLAAEARVAAGAHLRGSTRVGAGTVVEPGCVVTDSTVGAGALLKPHSVVTDSELGDGVQIGPFAHLRPGSVLERDVHVGNFVETKKTTLRAGAKANHLAYLGDGDVGAGSNIGAGTIFCNYDGFAKHRTVLGENVFIGSDSQLVAPITIGAGAYVATGTTVTTDVPADALAIGRTKQTNKEGYASRLRGRLRAAAGK